jgi:hypothetical protein
MIRSAGGDVVRDGVIFSLNNPDVIGRGRHSQYVVTRIDYVAFMTAEKNDCYAIRTCAFLT